MWFPSLEVGSIGWRSGQLTAAAGELEVRCWRRRHGPDPPVDRWRSWIARGEWSGLQEAEFAAALKPSAVVVSLRADRGGKAFNVIATTCALLKSPFRCLDNHRALPSLPAGSKDLVQASAGLRR